MYVRRNVRPSVMLWFCWRQVILFVLLSATVFWLYNGLHVQWVAIPFLPIGTIGTAVAFYVGFKNNSSYERLWEGRKIWEAITNLCRSWGMLVITLDSERLSLNDWVAIKQNLIRRHMSWCNLLRLQLRASAPRMNTGRLPSEVGLVNSLHAGDDIQDLKTYIDSTVPHSDRLAIQNKINPACELLKMQIAEVRQMHKDGLIGDLECEFLINNTLDCVKQQGSCERLKNFPFPRQYAYFSEVFVWIFLWLLPFSLVGEFAKAGAGLDWLVVPFSTLISWIFLTMEQVGDTSEDPFEMGLNDVPMSAICRDIEIELLEMLEEKELPKRLSAVADILM